MWFSRFRIIRSHNLINKYCETEKYFPCFKSKFYNILDIDNGQLKIYLLTDNCDINHESVEWCLKYWRYLFIKSLHLLIRLKCANSITRL